MGLGNQIRIKGQPDLWKGRVPRRHTGIQWIQSIAVRLHDVLQSPPKYLLIDLSNIEYLTLFEWTTFVSMLEVVLKTGQVQELGLDFLGDKKFVLLSVEEWMEFHNTGHVARLVRNTDFENSTEAYKLVAFAAALGTRAVLNRPGRGNITFPRFGDQESNFLNFYRRPDGTETLLLGLTRIESKDDCTQFLDEARILRWRNEMNERFRRSPIFEFEEVWRVFCHELAVNVWEHSHVPGFLSARVVIPCSKRGTLLESWQITYPKIVHNRIRQFNEGFLELCIADYGEGFAETLAKAFDHHTNGQPATAKDILSFAFDELGTCKSSNESWITERHALGRILLLVAKYGGILQLRSAGGAISYWSKEGHFQRRRNHRGYEPNDFMATSTLLRGAHLQILLPLVPRIPSPAKTNRASILDAYLPTSYHVDNSHVRGHLVPLLEELDQPQACVGSQDQLAFRVACENMCKRLLNRRADKEPFVLDFSGVEWTPEQFETLLHHLQNILQTRPSLLVELNPRLAETIIAHEAEAMRTALDIEAVKTSASVTGKSFEEIPERSFLETYRRIHCTIIGLDQNGRKYIFGLPERRYEDALLSLVLKSQSIEELAKTFHLDARALRAILTPVNQLFELDRRDINGAETSRQARWRCAWNNEMLAAQAERVMSHHFDKVMEVTMAWRGRPHPKQRPRTFKDINQLTLRLGEETGYERFNLPWQEDDEWVEEFLECSRVLSRERYANEAAQRLIYRLQKGLAAQGRTLADVSALACVTAPAILLATAIHRWWPEQFQATRPVVADLGYYLMLHPEEVPPQLSGEGGIVIIQDVLSSRVMSERLIAFLRRQSKNIVALLALVELVRDLPHTRVTAIAEGWLGQADGIPRHPMIQVRKPASCNPPRDQDEEFLAFWVEPRTLRPLEYRFLRREPEAGRQSAQRRLGLASKQLEELVGPVFSVGHYVYGTRHFSAVVDIRKCLTGALGEMVAEWVADVCEDSPDRPRGRWESLRGFKLKGEVTAVLMPLHSQIHYLWPKVENRLAQRGRRQPFWLLDATLFLGRGPAYRIPFQFEQLLDDALDELAHLSPKERAGRRIRLLVLDDAIATARTAETIMDAIQRALKEAYRRRNLSPAQIESPIQWIRYFTLLNYMGHAQMRHWQDLSSVGQDNAIPFVFEHYHHCQGISVHDGHSCPCCRDLSRARRLANSAKHYGFEPAREWAQNKEMALMPVAMDGPAFTLESTRLLSKGIELLNPKRNVPENERPYKTNCVDTAIVMFYELMYRSYPPSDLLRSMRQVMGTSDTADLRAYDRYRWAVLEWSTRNWPRILADSAREEFLACALAEIESNSPLIEELFVALSIVWREAKTPILGFLKNAIDQLVLLEQRRFEKDQWYDEDRIARVLRLCRGINLFLLCVCEDSYDDLLSKNVPGAGKPLLQYIGDATSVLPAGSSTFLRQMFLRFTRPQRFAEPRWALLIIAESLYRGRDPDNAPPGEHQLLPLLLKQIAADPYHRELSLLLQGSLSLFLAALEDLQPYIASSTFPQQGDIIQNGKLLLEWLGLESSMKQLRPFPATAINALREGLRPQSMFCQSLNNVFHEKLGALRAYFRARMVEIEKQVGIDRLAFEYVVNPLEENARLLVHVERLKMTLSNWVIDAIRDFHGKHKSKIVASVAQPATGTERIRFRLLTSFANSDSTNARIANGRCADVEEMTLRAFGIETPRWTTPDPTELEEGYLAACDLYVPAGFVERKES